MPTLLLKLAGPMQSWGSGSKFEIRRTEMYPTKSGVIGMAAAALGIPRDGDISELTKLHFGVRIDQPGRILKDYHIAKIKKEPYPNVTIRYYLEDAAFLVGLESDDVNFLEKLEKAFKHPAYPLYLGRRSCPVSYDLVIGIEDLPLIETLRDYKWIASKSYQWKNNMRSKLRILSDKEGGIPLMRIKDKPISFDIRHRKYEYRNIYEYDSLVNNDEISRKHDPFAVIEELEENVSN